MSIIETIPIDHVPADHTVHVAFFKDIQNSAFLHSQLLARNPDFEYALIDASVVRITPFDAEKSTPTRHR